MRSATTKMKSLKVLAFAIALSMMPGFVQAQNHSSAGVAGTWEGTGSNPVSSVDIDVMPVASGQNAGYIRWESGGAACQFVLLFRDIQNNSSFFILQYNLSAGDPKCLGGHNGLLSMAARGREARWMVLDSAGKPMNRGLVKKVN